MLTILLTILGFQMTPPPAIPKPEPRAQIASSYAEEQSDFTNGRNGVVDNGERREQGGKDGESPSPNNGFSPSDGRKPMPPREDYSPNYEVEGGNNGNGDIMTLPLVDQSGRVDTGSLADRKRALDERFSRMFELQSSLSERSIELSRDSEEYSLLKRAYSRELRRIIDEWIKQSYGTLKGE